ncbi:MAG: pitrilysin family protein [bacterium]|nr:pitrilysin family protein [bacterium]
MKFKKKTFKNGLRAIVAPMPSTETVSIMVLVGTGANYENLDNNGLSHFLEHMFFKGTKDFPKPGELDRGLDAVGAIHNAFTSREETAYWIKADAKKFDLTLHFVSDILQNALIKQEEIDKERTVILQEMKVWADNPINDIWSHVEALIYGDNSYGWQVIGTPKNIKTMGRAKFMKYWKSQYVASNTVVVVAGNVNEEQTFQKIEKAFENLRVGKHEKESAFKTPKPGPRTAIIERETEQSHVVVAALGYGENHKDRLTADVLGTILGGYMSSRLFEDIRGKLGLAYVVRAGHDSYRQTGFFGAYAGVLTEKRHEVIERIVGHLNRIKRTGPTSEEVTRAKENIKGTMALALESTDKVALFLGGQEILHGKIKKPEDIKKKLDKITKADLQRVAKDLFKPENLYLTIIGPRTDKDDYDTILNEV